MGYCAQNTSPGNQKQDRCKQKSIVFFMLRSMELPGQLIKPQSTSISQVCLTTSVFYAANPSFFSKLAKWAVATGAVAHLSPVLPDIPKPSKVLDFMCQANCKYAVFKYYIFWFLRDFLPCPCMRKQKVSKRVTLCIQVCETGRGLNPEILVLV